MTDKRKAESMLFEAQTTYLSDYHKVDILDPVPTVYRAKPRCAMRRPPPLRDVHTMSDWKAAAIPFDLLHQPRPILATSPWQVQKAYTEPEDTEREHSQKTRPRLVMTPAVSMDDIDDERARNVLCADMYLSDARRGQREALRPARGDVRAPYATHPARANPITLPKLVPPVVPGEWRMDSVTWDRRQLRAHCDGTRDFWLNIELPKCRACDESAVVKSHRRMLRQRK